MAIVNNVTRLLDQRHIGHEAFELPSEKLGARETASLLGIDPAVVFKTIVVTRDKPGKPLLVVVPGELGGGPEAGRGCGRGEEGLPAE